MTGTATTDDDSGAFELGVKIDGERIDYQRDADGNRSVKGRLPGPGRGPGGGGLIDPAASLYERAGATPFFEALVARFYDGVATDPLLRPLYPGGRPGAGAASADPVPHPVLGRAADLRRGTWSPAAAHAPRAVRDRAARAGPLARAHAGRDHGDGAAGRRRRRARALHRDGRRGDAQPGGGA